MIELPVSDTSALVTQEALEAYSDAPIYRGYDQARLDVQYNPLTNVQDCDEVCRSWLQRGHDVLHHATSHLNIPYDDHDRAVLDIFVPSSVGPYPVHVFFHGGYWMSGNKEETRVSALGLLKAGVMVVQVEYPLMPVSPMAEQIAACRSAMRWVYQNCGFYQGDPRNINVSGHCTGAHLAHMMTITDWPLVYSDCPVDLVKSATLISGLYDLSPVRLCYLREMLNLSLEEISLFSPINLPVTRHVPFIVAYGKAETDEFVRQSTSFIAHCRNASVSVKELGLPDQNHYTSLNAYVDGPVHEAMIKQLFG